MNADARMGSNSPPRHTDVFVIGGGPAGLATAIALRLQGFDVVVADRSGPSIDKVCAEGLMPDGIAALRRIGIELGPAHGAPFRGIRFLNDSTRVEAPFSDHDHFGLGVRRTVLHRTLMEHAEGAGVVMCWQSRVESLDPSGVTIDGRIIRCRWIIGADGFHSRVRRWTGLLPAWQGSPRIGFRQHFRIRPWTDFVEVHWQDNCQAYVTPISPDEVCVAMIGDHREARLADLPDTFPVLAKRLSGAVPLDRPRGAISMSVRLSGVTQGRVALVGDASGSVDAITGEGLSLAFCQGSALAASLAGRDLKAYDAQHRRICRKPLLMSRLLLAMGCSDALRRRAMRMLAAHPYIFSRLLAYHVGSLPSADLSPDVGNFSLRPLA